LSPETPPATKEGELIPGRNMMPGIDEFTLGGQARLALTGRDV